jgi:hypothetical protein
MRKGPGQVRFNLTPAMKRALHAVNNGYVTRSSSVEAGDTFQVLQGHATARTLWLLAGNRLIENGDRVGNTIRMRLTVAGLAMMAGKSK